MRINTKYDLGQTVFLIHDKEQTPRMITSIGVNPGHVVYQLSSGTSESRHYEMEISSEVNILLKTTD